MKHVSELTSALPVSLEAGRSRIQFCCGFPARHVDSLDNLQGARTLKLRRGHYIIAIIPPILGYGELGIWDSHSRSGCILSNKENGIEEHVLGS